MAQVKIAKIDTSQAQVSIKSLNQEIKNLKDQMAGLDPDSMEFQNLANQAKNVKAQIDSVNGALKETKTMDLGQVAANMAKIGAGVSGAFGIINTAMSLFGAETDDATKAVQKLQAVMLLPVSFIAIAEGIKALGTFGKEIKNVIDITQKGQKAIKEFNKTEGDRLKGKFGSSEEEQLKKVISARKSDLFFTNLRIKQRMKSIKYIDEELDKLDKSDKRYEIYSKDKTKEIDALSNLTLAQAKYQRQLNDATAAQEKNTTAIAKFIKFIKSPVKSLPGALSLITAAIIAIGVAIKAVNDAIEHKLITNLNKLKSTTDALTASVKEFSQFWDNVSKGFQDVNNIRKAVLELDNVNNSYAKFIANRKEAAQLDRESSKLSASLVGNVEAAARQANKVVEGLYSDNTQKTIRDWFRRVFSGEDLKNLEKLFDSSSFTKFEALNVADLVGLSDEQLADTAEEIRKNILELQEEVKPYIEVFQQQLNQLEENKDSYSKNGYETRKVQLQALLGSYQTYYDELAKYQTAFNTAIQGELTYRKTILDIQREEKQNEIGLFKAETEKRKATTKNYELTADYFDRTVAAYNKEIALAKKGSQEEANLKAQLYGYIEEYRKQLEEEFEESMRQVHSWSEEETSEFEKMLAKQAQQIHSFFDTWNQLTGDATEWEPVKMGAKERTDMLELINLTIEANNQFNILIDTVNRFGESSLGLSGSWSNVISDMQMTFNNFALAISKGGQATFNDWGNAIANVAQMTGTFLNALSDEQDSSTKEGFENQKKFQISATVMNMLGGIVSAWTSAMNPANSYLTLPGQIALGTATTAMITGIGAAQIAKIAKQQFGGDASAASSAINSTIIPPVQYSSLVQGAQTEGAIRDTRQYVSVVEIDSVQKRVNVAENESRY